MTARHAPHSRGTKSPKSGPDISLTGGRFSRRTIATPASGTHPMGARERLALFNMLGCAGQTVLDLFAGSGALGLEALSRGASHVTFVEKSPAACAVIRANLAKLRVDEATVEVIQDNALKGLCTKTDAPLASRGERARKDGPREELRMEDLAQSPAPYDLILVDPPYDHPEYFTTASISTYADFVKSGGTLVISHPRELAISPTDTLKAIKSRQYAGLSIDIFSKL